MGKVLNTKTVGNAAGHYVGRGSPLGNPFVLGRDGGRDEVCDRYDRHLAEAIVRGDRRIVGGLDALDDQDARCFCAPLRCHANTLVRVAPMDAAGRLAWAEQVLSGTDAPPAPKGDLRSRLVKRAD